MQQPDAMLSLVSVLVLGIVGTAGALVIFNYVVQLTNTVFTSSVTYLIPIVAILLGILDGESFWLQHAVGMLAILVGVWFGKPSRPLRQQAFRRKKKPGSMSRAKNHNPGRTNFEGWMFIPITCPHLFRLG